jgi:hypothetical protein
MDPVLYPRKDALILVDSLANRCYSYTHTKQQRKHNDSRVRGSVSGICMRVRLGLYHMYVSVRTIMDLRDYPVLVLLLIMLPTVVVAVVGAVCLG